VLIATGARWRRNGVGRWHSRAIEGLPAAGVLTPDDILHGARPTGAVAIFDDDHYYMAPVIAVLLADGGAQVTYVTTAGYAAEWSHYTGEQDRTQRQLLERGVEIITGTAVEGFDGATVVLVCAYSGRERRHAAGTLVLVTSREPVDELYCELAGNAGGVSARTLRAKIRRIGDCRQPGIIAQAVYAGHEAARELDAAPGELQPPRRDRSVIG
jgi:dimethylamine/trimethylamine dehydrogenase